MAIWQFHIYFIPRVTLLEKFGKIPSQLAVEDERSCYIENCDHETEPAFEDALTASWWLNLNVNINELFPLLHQFGDLQEWTATTDGLRSFGDSEANDISVSFDSNTRIVQELSCRIDISNLDRKFIDEVLLIAKRFNCFLMDSKGRLFQPETEELAQAIQLSNAKRFVTDPVQFLDDLSIGLVKPE